MYKVFKLNKNDKIEFTKDELKSLLDEVYKEGGKENNDKNYYWTPPYNWPNWVYCNTGSIVANDHNTSKVSITPISVGDYSTATSITTTSSTVGDTTAKIRIKDLTESDNTKAN